MTQGQSILLATFLWRPQPKLLQGMKKVIINFICIYMDSIQTYKRIMDGAGIYPGPICQILNLLYSFFSSFMMVHDLPYHTKKIGGKNEASQVGFWICDHLVQSCLDARRDPSHVCSSRMGEHIQGSEIHTSPGQGLGRGLASWQLCPGPSVPTVSASASHVHPFRVLCSIWGCSVAVELVASPFQLHWDGT